MARLDSWLWAVRMYKTRSQATDAVRGGHVRVDDKLAKAAQEVVTGQRIRVRRDEHLGTRQGGVLGSVGPVGHGSSFRAVPVQATPSGTMARSPAVTGAAVYQE